MKNKVIDFLKNKKVISYIAIILVAGFSCIPLFSKYMGIAVDDGIQHICRLIGTYASLKEGNMFPVIMSKFCNGFGYSWNIFYSPLTAYLPLIFKIFTNSFVLCLKLFMFSTILLSGIFMYKLVYKIHGTHTAGVISALIYMTAPYHLTDMYNRVAVAELTSFVFLPIVFIGMYDLFRENKKTYYIAIGAIGLTLTHNVITIYTALFCFIYVLANYKKLKNKKVINAIIINILLILMCTSFYWIPLLEHCFGTTYEVFIPGRMFKDKTLLESQLQISDLFTTKPWGINFHIGLPITFGLILTFIYRNKIEAKYKKDVLMFLTFGILSIIMTLPIFPFEYLPSILKMMQFTWRMIEFEAFFLSIVSGITITMFVNKDNLRKLLVSIIFMLYLLILVNDTKYMTEVPFNEKRYLEPVSLETIVGPTHPGCATFEYLPKKAFSNLEYIKARSENCVILQGNANINNENKQGTDCTFEIENVKETVKIELPYIYYLGYKAELTDENGNVSNVKIKESDNGFCMIELSNIENGNVKINYDGTNLMKISYIVTILGIVGMRYYIKKSR